MRSFSFTLATMAFLVLLMLTAHISFGQSIETVNWLAGYTGRLPLPGHVIHDPICYLDGREVANLTDNGFTLTFIEDDDNFEELETFYFEACGKYLESFPGEVTRYDLVNQFPSKSHGKNLTCRWLEGNLTVYPTVFGFDGPRLLEEGKELTFTCVNATSFYYTVGIENPDMTPIQNKSQFIGRLNVTGNTLRLSNVTPNDDGLYTCGGDNVTDMSTTTTIRLVVQALTDKCMISVPYGEDNDLTTLLCADQVKNVTIRGNPKYVLLSKVEVECYRMAMLIFNGTVEVNDDGVNNNQVNATISLKPSWLNVTTDGRRINLHFSVVNTRTVGTYYCYWGEKIRKYSFLDAFDLNYKMYNSYTLLNAKHF